MPEIIENQVITSNFPQNKNLLKFLKLKSPLKKFPLPPATHTPWVSLVLEITTLLAFIENLIGNGDKQGESRGKYFIQMKRDYLNHGWFQ